MTQYLRIRPQCNGAQMHAEGHLPGTVLRDAWTQLNGMGPLKTVVSVALSPRLAQNRAVPSWKSALSQNRKSSVVANLVFSALSNDEVPKRKAATFLRADTF